MGAYMVYWALTVYKFNARDAVTSTALMLHSYMTYVCGLCLRLGPHLVMVVNILTRWWTLAKSMCEICWALTDAYSAKTGLPGSDKISTTARRRRAECLYR